MPTLLQLKSWVDQEIRKGKGELHTNRIAIIEEAAKKRAENAPDDEGRRKTKIAWESGDADSYAAWHKERERWMTAAEKNPTVATDMMIVALKAYSEEAMREIKHALEKVGS